MLPREHRLVRPAEFSSTVRSGRRAGDGTLVVHRLAADVSTDVPARVGFVVSRAVGGAVVRNRVKRRLRALVGQRLVTLQAGERLVVRALPPSASSSSVELSASLDRCLHRVQSVRPRSVEV